MQTAPAPRTGRPRSPAWLPVALLLTNGLVGLLTLADVAPALLLLFEAMDLAAVVIVWRSRHWTVGQKWSGIALALILPGILRLIWNLGVPEDMSGRDAWRWVLLVTTLILNVSGCASLWRTRRR
ncbi:hypothetical protein ACIRJR_18090 [Streptomyces sp. NPDC102402]|uniref:hypothetical protein n=1 Tax=Streptomyces sp. NPDC102402 TaxID=3366169 RepID=UPI0038250509